MNSQVVPWYKNAIAFVSLGLAFLVIVLACEVGLKIMGYPEGLPESVTTALVGVGNLVIGYASGCLNLRSGNAEPPDPINTS